MKVPLNDQIEALREVLEHGLVDKEDPRIAALFKTLAWMEKNAHTFQMAAAIVKEDSVQTVLDAFPGASIIGCRKVDMEAIARSAFAEDGDE